jgi:hypothetical protein
MLRRPLFACKYYLLARGLSLGRPEPPRSRHARVVAGVLAGLVLAGATGAAIVTARDFRGSGGSGASAAAKPQTPLLITDSWWYPQRADSTASVAGHPPGTQKPVEQSTASRHRRSQPPPTRRTVLVSETVSRPTAAVRSAGPTPLKAPKSGPQGAPRPLGAP